MIAIKRQYNSKENISKKLKELILELNIFTEEVEHWKLNDANYTVEINTTDNKNKRFKAKLIEKKVYNI